MPLQTNSGVLALINSSRATTAIPFIAKHSCSKRENGINVCTSCGRISYFNCFNFCAVTQKTRGPIWFTNFGCFFLSFPCVLPIAWQYLSASKVRQHLIDPPSFRNVRRFFFVDVTVTSIHVSSETNVLFYRRVKTRLRCQLLLTLLIIQEISTRRSVTR